MSKFYDLGRYVYRLLVEEKHNKRFYRTAYYWLHRNRYNASIPKVFVLTTPEYGNIGDHAIAYAEIKYLKEKFPGHDIITIPDSEFNNSIGWIAHKADSKDVIALIGGGNFGVLYPGIEYNRRYTIRKCKKTPIIMFPQSSVWGDGWYERLQIKRSSRIYAEHNNLHLMAREEKTFDVLKKWFSSNHIYLTPDIVLSQKMDYLTHTAVSRTALVCLRNDTEKQTPDSVKTQVMQFLNQNSIEVKLFDTETYSQIRDDSRDRVIEETFITFSKVDFVITDRLHGMIFSNLAGVPCLALDNSTKKVSGVYDLWIDKQHTLMCSDVLQIDNCLNQLIDMERFQYIPDSNKRQFDRVFANIVF